MTITSESTLREVAFCVCTAFHDVGVVAVLTGGSAVTVYAPHAYQSRDLGFILHFHAEAISVEKAILDLGYRCEGQVYVHQENPLTLDFPPEPLAIGSEYIKTWSTLEDNSQILHLLNPTDCCKGRLAGDFFWKDFSSLDQALVVARAQADHINLEEIRRWCKSEGEGQGFDKFYQELTRGNSS